MKISNDKLQIREMCLDFPAVGISIGGEFFQPSGAGEKIGENSFCYRVGKLTFVLSVEQIMPDVYRKRVRIIAAEKMPTPDYVEVDRQKVSDHSLERRGYRASADISGRPGAEEEGGGLMPGCGYPLVGKNFFAGLEHPAAFNEVVSADHNSAVYRLFHHPVWDENNVIECVPAVFGCSGNAEKSFRRYVDMIRLPALEKPLFSLCSFWSDPYLGNYEYLIAPENYRTFVKAFERLGIHADIYTLDAGWQDRQSIFAPKASFNGEQGLMKLQRFIRRMGSEMSLWISHNGPMGIAPEYLKSLGIAVGTGESSCYCGPGYGVLLDGRLEKLLGDRFCSLARRGIKHFKIDWDNDCAVNEDFTDRYPSRDHVREGSINAMIRISSRIRQAGKDVIMRNGWWPSPWHLMYAHHVFLSDSNDSEYATLPSRTQRDSAATYRDSMYYCMFQRDRSILPLDALDNHEFPHAMRNPFHEVPRSMADIAMLAVMRGTSYLPLTLQPEALEDEIAAILRNTMQFARSYGKNWYCSSAGMIGGNPNAGEIYGFIFEQKDRSAWMILRNPSALPQKLIRPDEQRSGVMIYPYIDRYRSGEELIFSPHEVKVFILNPRRIALPWQVPFQAEMQEDGKTAFRFPGNLTVNRQTAPMVGKIYRINRIEYDILDMKKLPGGLEVIFKLRLPYRMRDTTINAAVTADDPGRVHLTARFSRAASDEYSCCQLPVTALAAGVPGLGLVKNPDMCRTMYPAIFTIPASEGGEAYYSLFFENADSFEQIKLSVSGFIPPSRSAFSRCWKPSFLTHGLPPIQPAGFPVAEFLDLPDPSDAADK